MDTPGKLTDKQQRFVEEYLVDLKAGPAYKRAGYKATGNAAEAAASRLLRNVKVQTAITEGKAARSARVEITQDYVLRQLKSEAEDHGDGSSHSARVAALKLLGLHVGLFGDKIELSGKDSAPIPLAVRFVEALKVLTDGSPPVAAGAVAEDRPPSGTAAGAAKR
jgi:hypothetical protein